MFKKENYLKKLIINNNFPHNVILDCRSIPSLQKTACFIIESLFNQNGLNQNINYEKNSDAFIEIGDFERKILKNEILKIIDHFTLTSFGAQKIKIYKINGLELMTPPAAVCLLKFMEDHSKEIYGIFLSKASHVILPTLQSRTMKIYLDNNDISNDIKKINLELIDNLKQLLINKNRNF